jgi:hypothetical protein
MVDSSEGRVAGANRGRRRRIFICYRRSDSQPWAGRLADDLREYFGPGRIYRDIDSNRVGADYTELIDQALDDARVVIVLIGPHWLDNDGDGRPRLHDPRDLVRQEVERALASGVAIIPVLVGGGEMPKPRDLPESLESLTLLHGQRLRDEDWRHDFGGLLRALEQHGVLPDSSVSEDDEETLLARAGRLARRVQRYERLMKAPSRRRVYDAVLGAVERLRYPQLGEGEDAAQVRFRAFMRDVTAHVADAKAGHFTVFVEFQSVSWKVLVGMGVIGPFAWLAGGGVRVLERRFASGFLDNVQRMLDGREIGPDSALFPGFEKIRDRSNSRRV